MASSVRQSIFTFAKIAVNGAKGASVLGRQLQAVTSQTQTRGLLTLRNVAVPSRNGACGCRYYATAADQDLINALDKEITSELEQAKAVKDIKGWTSQTDGANVTLSKSLGSEKISVKFTINNSLFVPDGELPEMQEEETKEEETEVPPQVSKPAFDVDIEKGSGKKLRMVCEFAQEQAFYPEGEGEQVEDDLFGIEEVHFINGEEKESDYFLTGESMDADMYQVLMDMLDERGVDDEFINNLMDYCTSYEHSQYITFLKDVQAFVKE